jgi:hypothetical protein
VGAADTVSYVIVGLLMVGIARAWELVGDRDTGILASITFLAGSRLVRDDDARASAAPADPAGS